MEEFQALPNYSHDASWKPGNLKLWGSLVWKTLRTEFKFLEIQEILTLRLDSSPKWADHLVISVNILHYDSVFAILNHVWLSLLSLFVQLGKIKSHYRYLHSKQYNEKMSNDTELQFNEVNLFLLKIDTFKTMCNRVTKSNFFF